jgi:hypothetical protein
MTRGSRGLWRCYVMHVFNDLLRPLATSGISKGQRRRYQQQNSPTSQRSCTSLPAACTNGQATRCSALNGRIAFSIQMLKSELFLDAFAKQRKATISFVMSIPPSVCPHGTIPVPLGTFSGNFIRHDFF